MSKRFISKNESIINVTTDELVNANSEESAEILVGWLNELNDENNQFKSENIKLTVDNKELKCTNNELYQDKEQLKDENKQLKQELRFIQSELHNASLDVRERTLKEVSDAIEKIKRYE